MKLDKIFKTTATGKTQEWEIEIDGNKYRTITGQSDGKKITNEWTVCEGKNIGRSNETTPEEQAMSEALALRKKKLDKDYVENVHEETTYLSPMLAHTYDAIKTKLTFPVYVQPKLDGLRCLHYNNKMMSRNGKEFFGCPHILNPDIARGESPIISIDGELYNHEYCDDFNTIVSIVKKQTPTDEELEFSRKVIKYYVYDLIIPNTKFSDRFEMMRNMFSSIDLPNWELVETYHVHSLEEMEKLYEYFLDEGYEGMIIRLDGVYEHKRSKNLLKRKEFQDDEFVILDIIEGVGNRSGMAGYITTQTKDGKPFKSNIKGDRSYLKELLSNKSEYVGKSATIKFFRYTPDGIPRFPYVMKISREDYE